MLILKKSNLNSSVQIIVSNIEQSVSSFLQSRQYRGSFWLVGWYDYTMHVFIAKCITLLSKPADVEICTKELELNKRHLLPDIAIVMNVWSS